MLMYLILTCKDRELFFSIIIISTFFKFRKISSDLFRTLEITERPISVKLNANLLPVCII